MLKIKYCFLFRTTLLALFFMFVFVNHVFADVNNISRIAFITEAQSIGQDVISGVITIQTQNSDGVEEKITESTNKLTLTINSTTGVFSSSKTTWKSENIITMSKNTSNRSFYYKDVTAGSFIITAKLTSGETGKSWTSTQDITIGSSSGGGDVGTSTLLTKIVVTNPPTITIYQIGEPLNISGMIVTGTYGDNSNLVEPITVDNISGFDNSTSVIGQILTILYKEKTATFSVDISSTTTTSTATTTEVIKIVNHYISTHSDFEELSVYATEDPFKISAGRERIAYVGTPLSFVAKHNKLNKSPDFTWSFGDATQSLGDESVHTYKHSGEYFVVLNGIYGTEKAISRTSVKVFEPQIKLSLNLGNLELKNNAENEINIGGWKIKSVSSEFIIPKDTIVGSNNKIILLPKDIGFSFAPGDLVKIENQSMNVVAFVQIGPSDLLKLSSNSLDISYKNVSTLEDILGLKIEQAEKIVTDQKLKIAAVIPKKPVLSIKPISDSYNSVGSQLKDSKGDEADTMLATVDEAINSTTTLGFWSRLIMMPSNELKAITRVFYDI